MDIADFERMKRHMGKGVDITIKNEKGEEDIFHLEQLGCEFLPELMLIYGEAQDAKTFADFSEQGRKALTTVIMESVKLSYPKPESISDREYNQIISKFVSDNFLTLMDAVLNLNNLGASTQSRKAIDKIDRIRKRVKYAKTSKDITGAKNEDEE